MELTLRMIKTSWQGFKRNGWLSFVAIFMMMQALLLITLFVSLNIGVDKTIQAINERIDVAVFFKEYISEDSILTFKEEVENVVDVKSVTYISQVEALDNYIAQNQDSQALLDVIGEDASFLPASLEIKVDDPYVIESVVGEIESRDENDIILETTLKKNQEVINRLRQINQFAGFANIVLSLIFIIIALLIIFNTIRITIFTRREEIEIMKLVGATDWYIRWPFIVEGIIYGIAGAILAFIISILGYWLLASSLSGQYFSMGLTNVQLFNPLLFIELFIIQLLIGILVGAISSYLSTKRHLRV
jgi:cell division transport system permease protein